MENDHAHFQGAVGSTKAYDINKTAANVDPILNSNP